MGKPNFIYIGPNVGHLGLKRNTIFRGDHLPPKLQGLAESKPVLRSLFISTRNLAEAKKKLAEKGSVEFIANKEMLVIAKTVPQRET